MRSKLLRRFFLILSILAVILVTAGLYIRYVLRANYNPSGAGETQISLPPGFVSRIYARGMDRPRFMAVAEDGVAFVATQGGRVFALQPNGTGEATLVEVAQGLDSPSSVWIEDATHLLVGETQRVTRLTLGADLHATAQETVVSGLPGLGGHSTRTVAIGADGKLYVSIGSSCNVCVETDPYRASIWVFDLDGKNGRVYASGLRNAVGLARAPFALAPGDTSGLWATNMGRDLLGDDTPPETVYALFDGLDAGWPRCHAARIPDMGTCDGVTKPVLEMQAHSAPLALLFYTGTQFPAEYQGNLFIAFHGSWNRSEPTGYKIVRVPMNGAEPAGPLQDFAGGFLQSETATGRPAGLAQLPDGSLLVSDDKGGFIYRIAYAP